jgi:DNA-binding NarL/FixJ family response regulator
MKGSVGRQKQVAGGNRNRDIAEALFLKEETVKVHIKHIMEKLRAADPIVRRRVSHIHHSSSTAFPPYLDSGTRRFRALRIHLVGEQSSPSC